jgi:hypothetical protein
MITQILFAAFFRTAHEFDLASTDDASHRLHQDALFALLISLLHPVV